jgi:signal transduction histidine kinase
MARVVLVDDAVEQRAHIAGRLAADGHEVLARGAPAPDLIVLGPGAPPSLAAELAREAAGAPLLIAASLDLEALAARARGLLRERAVAQAARDPRAFVADTLGQLSTALRGAAGRLARAAADREFVAWPGDTGAAARGATDVAAALAEAVAMARDDIARRAELVERHAPMPPVLASGRQLSRIFYSLLANAVEATPEGQPAAHRIEVRSSTDAAGWAVVEIADTGAGIPAAILGRIFEAGFTTKGQSGIGLGLAVCHGTVAALGGRISVESEVGRGSTFRVALPPASP